VAAFDQLWVTCRLVVRLADREIEAIAAFHPLQTLVEFVVTAGIGMVRLRALQVSSEQAGNLNYSEDSSSLLNGGVGGRVVAPLRSPKRFGLCFAISTRG
jgi:hypothetical protein